MTTALQLELARLYKEAFMLEKEALIRGKKKKKSQTYLAQQIINGL